MTQHGWLPRERWWSCPPCDVRWSAQTVEPCWSCGGHPESAYRPTITSGQMVALSY